jgi:hypothetical protein
MFWRRTVSQSSKMSAGFRQLKPAENSTKYRCFPRVKPKTARLPKKNNFPKICYAVFIRETEPVSAPDAAIFFDPRPLN